MGWANCGTDTRGRPIGYAHPATCDHPGCDATIHRGLAYACGGMHGDDEVSCEKYFCPTHLSGWVRHADGKTVMVCEECEAIWRKECPKESAEMDAE